MNTSMFLSQAVKLQMVNSVFTCLSTFFVSGEGQTLVTKAKKDGGLGVLDLKTHNEALLTVLNAYI
jgi:hypothetical protein